MVQQSFNLQLSTLKENMEKKDRQERKIILILTNNIKVPVSSAKRERLLELFDELAKG
jgi:hypothetical protein